MCTQERVFVLLNFIFCISFEKRNIYGIVEKYMQRCLVLNFWFYYIFFTFMASFIYDTGLPWSFFLENIVFQKNQTKNQTFHRKHFVSLLPGWGNKTYWYAHIYIYIFCMNLLAPHPMFTASFRKKGQIPDLKVILHHILLRRRGILGITTNIQSHVPTKVSKMEARGVGCIEYRTLHSGG